MMDIWQFIVTALAAWRLAHLLVHEDGPFSVFARLRARAGLHQVVVDLPDGTTQIGWSATNTLAEGLMCLWCVSLWTAGGLLLVYLIPGTVHQVWYFATAWLAISALALGYHEGIARLRGTSGL